MTTIRITIPELNEHTRAILQLLRTDKSINVYEEDEFLNAPKWQIEEVNKREKYLSKNPESSIDLDEALNALEKKYDL